MDLKKPTLSDSESVDRIPAWTVGCSVLTLPFSISGEFVIADMSLFN